MVVGKMGAPRLGRIPASKYCAMALTARYAGMDMEAISLCDNAIWDIKAKAANMPLNQLLGGLTQETLPAYINCFGYSFQPDDMVRTVEMVKKQGFKGMKTPYDDL